jgi:hypothetical protein
MYMTSMSCLLDVQSGRSGNSDFIGELQYRPSLSGYFALILIQTLRASKYLWAGTYLAVALVFQLTFPVLVPQYFSMWLAVACLGAFSASLFYMQTSLPAALVVAAGEAGAHRSGHAHA